MDFEALSEGINGVLNWASQLGSFWMYTLIIAACFVENVFPPFPGDTVTIAGAALATRGELSFELVFVCSYIGGLASSLLVYRFARTHGHEYFMNRNFKLFPRERILTLEKWLMDYGAWIITAHRFLLGLRSVLTIATGILRWPLGRMTLYASISYWLFNGLLIFATYLLIDNLEKLTEWLEMYQIYVLIALGALLVWAVIRWRMHKASEG